MRSAGVAERQRRRGIVAVGLIDRIVRPGVTRHSLLNLPEYGLP